MPTICSTYANKSSKFSRRVKELGLQGGWIEAAKAFDAAPVNSHGERDMPSVFTCNFPPSRDRALHDMLYSGMPASCFESGFFHAVFGNNIETQVSKVNKGVLLLCEQVRGR